MDNKLIIKYEYLYLKNDEFKRLANTKERNEFLLENPNANGDNK